MARWFLIRVVRIIIRLIARVEIVGLERFKPAKVTIIVANHLGRLDAPLIMSLDEFVQHPNLVVVVAEKYQRYLIYRWAVRVMNFIWLDRFSSDIGALREVVNRLKSGGLMVIAPEGTRSPEESLIEGKPGAAYLAAKTDALLVPVSVTGTEDRQVKESLRRFRRAQIKLTIGEPFRLKEMPRRGRDEYLRESTAEIMCQIAALLPESYRGVYRDHPRLHALIRSRRGKN